MAWQRAHELALAVFRATQSLSRTHNWLRSQCTRSAVSVAANIAEGYSRGSLKEYLQFLNIARGSLAETEYYLLFMGDAGLLPPSAFAEREPLVTETGNLLLGLIRSLRAKEPSSTREVGRVREERSEYVVPPLEAATALDPRPSTLDPWEAS